MKWIYHQEAIWSLERLNVLGAQGWELMLIQPMDARGEALLRGDLGIGFCTFKQTNGKMVKQ